MAPQTIDDVETLRGLVGQQVGTSDWLQVTQAMIDAFADVTGDDQWIHRAVKRAQRESPFGATIAHGFLTLSLLTRLHNEAVVLGCARKMGINYGLNRVRFSSPVRSGSRIRGRSAVQSIEDVRGGVQVTWLITIDLEDSEKPALVAEWITRIYQ
jgi:acyl dehydratase